MNITVQCSSSNTIRVLQLLINSESMIKIDEEMSSRVNKNKQAIKYIL